MSSEMTMLCGFGMSESTTVEIPPMSNMRHLQAVVPTEGQTITVDDNGDDVVLTLWPATPLNMVNFVLPVGGENLQIVRIASMLDIAATMFGTATVLNAPMELLANQAVTLQRIDGATNTWITV